MKVEIYNYNNMNYLHCIILEYVNIEDVPLPTTFTGITVNINMCVWHALSGGIGKLNTVSVIPHCECSVDEEV